MTRFYPLYIRRSDGKREVATRKGKEKNEPSPEQLDRTPNAKGVCDYYREIGYDEVKHLDWRRKLAGMLVREIGGKEYEDRANVCILQDIPENYRLYEHIKSRVMDSEGKPVKSTKNHAGGGHDRQDAYLYGHPMGPKKRYRSPADFFPHLLWLATDETGNPDNCACKICCPEELDDKATTKAEAKPTVAIKKEESQTKSPTPNATPSVIQRQPPAAQPPVQSAPKPQAPKPLAPTPLPQPRSVDQQIDAQYNKFLYRPGEVVWFQLNTGAWGLAVVTRRYVQHDVRSYVVQPLSHPLEYEQPVTITDSRALRPWLAWSAPSYTFKYLRDRQMSYDSVDWHGLLLGRYPNPPTDAEGQPLGPGDVKVDASILAAKTIDSTYTTIDFLKQIDAGNGNIERRWNGIFLGGEKVWVGEVVRLRTNELIVVTEIIENISPDNPREPTIKLGGDIYTTVAIDPSHRQPLPDDLHIPIRMREDLRWRNNIALRYNRAQTYYKLKEVSKRVNIAEVKGRWWEASILFPIICSTEELNESIKKGGLTDTTFSLNGRHDCNPHFPRNAGIRKQERRDAFGNSIPPSTRFVPGIDPPRPEESAPQAQAPRTLPVQAPSYQGGHAQQQQSQQQQSQTQQQGQQTQQQQTGSLLHDPAHGALEEFMNLDGMDHDAMPGFGQSFAGPGGDGHYQF